MPPCVMNFFKNPYNHLIYRNNIPNNEYNYNMIRMGNILSKNQYMNINNYYSDSNNYRSDQNFNLKGREMFKIRHYKSCGCGG